MRHIIPLLLILLVGCDDQTCSPGSTQQCFCLSGATGVQTCNSSGTQWGECSCESTDTSTDPDVTPDTTPDTYPDNPEETECTVAGDCDDEDPCTTDSCNDTGDCVNLPADEDDDGFLASVVDSTDCGGTDCDDSDDEVYPDSDTRRCGEDADCNGLLDADNDDDGYDRTDCSGEDCDDEEPLRNPGIEPECGTDSTYPWDDMDCNGYADIDNDNDGQDDIDCTGYSEHDCDDSDPDIYFGADEVCNDGVDQDCDGFIDGPLSILSDVRLTFDGYSDSPSMVWTGSEYGLAWHDDRYGGGDILFARVDGDGTKVGSDLRISDVSGIAAHPFLEWTGSEYGLAWEDYSDGTNDIVLQRLDATGAEIGSEVWLVSTDQYEIDPRLVWAGSMYGLCFRHDEDGTTADDVVTFARFGADGSSLGPTTFVNASGAQASSPFCVWTGSEFGLTWTDQRDGNPEIYFAALDATGMPIGSTVRVTNDTAQSWAPAIAWSGSEYGLVWRDERIGGQYEVFINRLDSTGSPILSDANLTSASEVPSGMGILWVDGAFLVSWNEYESGSEDQEIWYAFLDPDYVGYYKYLTSDSYYSGQPVTAWTGSEVGIAWIDAREMQYEVFFNRLGMCE